MKFISNILILVVLISLISTSPTQTGWTKYPGNPVLDVGPRIWVKYNVALKN